MNACFFLKVIYERKVLPCKTEKLVKTWNCESLPRTSEFVLAWSVDVICASLNTTVCDNISSITTRLDAQPPDTVSSSESITSKLFDWDLDIGFAATCARSYTTTKPKVTHITTTASPTTQVAPSAQEALAI
ncbi:hypothetical protein GQ600_2760 [Phytophthora cactorum]|nr:hypothetical protein GQ600_2760 [Phytophthora cactorum]